MKKFTLTALLVGLMILPAIYVFSQQRIHLPQKQTKCWIEKSYLQSIRNNQRNDLNFY